MRRETALLLFIAIGVSYGQVRYFGKQLGQLSTLQHGVHGTVFAVDSRTIYIQNFHYDGEGPSAYFFMGTSTTPRAGAAGTTRLRDERGGTSPLRKYNGESITLTLPDGKTLKDFRWFSVYCEEYEVNFGDVTIPRGVEYPRPVKVAALKGIHGVHSDPILVVDAQTLLVPNFSYDGEAPDAKFWVGRGDKPSPQGIRIPDENGKESPLRRYDRKTIVLTLPGELTVFDIGHFGVWCEAFTVDFGHVVLPRAALASVPPSLKMLGVSPQSRNNALVESVAPASPARRPLPRAPLSRLDATTYRPATSHLRPGASLLSSLQHEPQDRTNLYRRANLNTPPVEQLVDIQSSQELEYHENGDINFNEQQNQQLKKQQPLTLEEHYQQKNQQQKLLQQYQDVKPKKSQPLILEDHYQQQQRGIDNQQQHQIIQKYQEQKQIESQSPTVEQQYQQLVLQQQLLEKELQQRQQLLQQAQEQLYYSQRPQNYQQKLQNQPEHRNIASHQEIYEQQLVGQPVQYRLLPY